MPSMDQRLQASQEMRAWISPSLIEANHILSLSQQALQALVQQEMAENPALELESLATCPVCQSPLESTWCPNCQQTMDRVRSTESLDAMDDYEVPSAPSAPASSADEFDPMTIIASAKDAREQLREDVFASLHEDDHPVADMIIDSMNERGFLTMSAKEIAERLQVEEQDVEDVLAVVQSVAPVGVGARTLQECLTLQIQYLQEMNAHIPAFTDIVVRDYLDELGAHRYGFIQKQLNVTADDLDEIRDFVRQHLSPFPLQSHTAESWQSPSDDGHVTPDVIVDLIDDQLAVRIADNSYFHLRTNGLYQQLSAELSSRRINEVTAKSESNQEEPDADTDLLEDIADAAANVSDDERAHIRSYTQRAQQFMNNIEQRQSTLLRIAECTCRFQEDFLREGVREIRPLTRAMVAQEVGVHESTVSRATANKFVQLPTRRVIPFSDFFTANLGAKDAIRQIIERGSVDGEPLTDIRIVELLQDQGIRIARRTVAKYRGELGILPSSLR